MTLAASGLDDGYVSGLEAVAHSFRPKRPLSIPGWADSFRWIGRPAAEPGPWRTDRIPFLRGPMEALDRRDPAPIVVLVKSSQVGGTEAGLCWLGRAMHQQPTSFLALFPTDRVGRKWVRTKLRRMLAATPALRAIVASGRRAKQTSTLLELHFGDGILIVGSANNKDDLATVDAECLFLDEVDRMPATLEGEGDPIELAFMRQATFPRRKAFLVSSPTTEDASHIWPYWLASTMERFHVPCPHCGEAQAMTFDNLKWPDGNPRLAVYRCAHCDSDIDERHKTDMLHGGRWIAEHPERGEVARGFHVNALYTPIGLGHSWRDHAGAWERVRGEPKRVQVYYNTRRGEPVRTAKMRLAWETVAARREPFSLRTVPAGYLILTAFADVQKDRLEVLVLAFGRGEKCATIDYTILEGDPTRAEVWKSLDDYLAQPIENSFGVPMRVACAMVDAGNWQHDVTNFTRSMRARHVYASKGSSNAARQAIGRPTMVDVKAGGKMHKRGAELYVLGVSELKKTLYARIDADEQSLPSDRHVRFSVDLPDEFFRQLCAERRTEAGEWEKTYQHNEALDLTVGCLAAAMHHATPPVNRMGPLDWKRLEELYERAPAAEKPKTEALGYEPIATSTGFFPTSAIVRR